MRPEPELLDLSKPVTVTVNGARIFSGPCDQHHEIRIAEKDGSFSAETEQRVIRHRTLAALRACLERPISWRQA